MPLQFETSNEAFLSVLAVVVGADQVGSVAERDFLFEKVRSLPNFGNSTLPEFRELLGQVTDKVYSALPQAEGAITSAGLDELLAAAKSKLSPELQKTLVRTAAQLCETDETNATEASLLSRIRRAFG